MSIALIAGTGGLPPHLAARLLSQGRVPVICEMRGFRSDVTGEFTRIPFRLETLGTLLATLTALGVTQVCMAGAVQRPDVDPSAIDAATAPLVARLMAAMAKGDDGTLREVIAIFEDHGFSVIGAHQIAPDLLPASGVKTIKNPPDLSAGLAAAKAALAEMGRADLGQAVLVGKGDVIAREDARGTAAMLHDFGAPSQGAAETGLDATDVFGITGAVLGGVADWLSATDNPPAPVPDVFLFKAPKPDQIMSADMPLIGPETATQAAKAGLAGIVIPKGRVMVLDLAQVVAVLDAHGMYLWVTP